MENPSTQVVGAGLTLPLPIEDYAVSFQTVCPQACTNIRRPWQWNAAGRSDPPLRPGTKGFSFISNRSGIETSRAGYIRPLQPELVGLRKDPTDLWTKRGRRGRGHYRLYGKTAPEVSMAYWAGLSISIRLPEKTLPPKSMVMVPSSRANCTPMSLSAMVQSGNTLLKE